MNRMVRGAIVSLAALTGSACYVYVPAAEPAPPVGEPVRVLIQPSAANRLSVEAGRPISSLEGRVVETSDDTLRVSVMMRQPSPVVATDRPRQVFSVSSSEILQVQREQLSKQRTALLTVGSIALLALVISQFEAVVGGDPGSRPYPGGDAPSLFRLPGIEILRH